jgi:gliding motility-associated-like protein
MKTLTNHLSLLVLVFVFSFSASAQNDVGITGCANVVSGCNLNCVLPQITIVNYGPLFYGDLYISYTVNSGSSVYQTIPPTNYANGSTYLFTFNPPDSICFPTQGIYTVVFTVAINPPAGPDINPANNSFTLTVVNDTTVVPGIISSSDSVCQGVNSGLLTLTNYTGYSGNWEMDNGGGWQPTPGLCSGANCSYLNLNQNTIYRVWQDGGFCPGAWSQWAVITTVAPPVGGTTVSTVSTVCTATNSFQLSLSGQSGIVTAWNTSTACVSPWTPDASLGTGIQMSDTNITQTTCYVATISNGGYCPDVYSSPVTITVTPPTVAGSVISNATVCSANNGDTLYLTGNQGNVLYWVQMDTAGNISPMGNLPVPTMQVYNNLNSTTQFAAVVQNGICPADTSLFAIITVVPSPVIFAGNDTTINLGSTLCFNATGGLIYSWTPSTGLNNPGLSNPCFTPLTFGTYTFSVNGQDVWGCSSTDQVTVYVLDTVTVFPPVVCNFVTPNNDGLNDVWNIMNIARYPDNEVSVFNNHGQQVYSKTGYNNEWDGTYNGKRLPDGSYYYVVKINATEKLYKGVVTITNSMKP